MGSFGLHNNRANSFRPDLEGLRGVAVVAVVLFHAGIPAFSGGFLGVDAFFVLSGYLITALLLREVTETGRLEFSQFYARRIRRLLPAALVLVAITFIGTTLLVPGLLNRQEAWVDGISSLLSVVNLRFILVAHDYFAPAVDPSPFLQMWSLSVEEQFYLIWPAILVVSYKVFHRNITAMSIFIGVITLISFLLFASGALGPEATFYSLPTRAWELGIGALIATSNLRLRIPQTASLTILFVSLLLPALDARLTTVATLITCVSVALIISSGAGSSWGTRALESRPLRFLGKISYSLYLWHWPAIVLLSPFLGVPLAICIALLAAIASERFIEAPFRLRHIGTTQSRRVIALGLSVLICGSALAGATQPTFGASILVRPDSGDQESMVELQPSLADLAKDTPYQRLGECYGMRGDSAPPPSGCIWSYGNALRIALVGDSYAAQWYPALDRIADHVGATLLVLAKTGCPQLVEPNALISTNAEYSSCAPYSASVRDRLEEFAPDLIITAYGEFALVGGEVRSLEQESAAMRTGLRRLISIAPVVYISPVPVQPVDPTDCLDANRDDPQSCSADLASPETFPLRSRDQIALAGVEVDPLDPQSLFCTESTCPLVDGAGIIKNRDAKHASATFSEAVWEKLLTLLRASGAKIP